MIIDKINEFLNEDILLEGRTPIYDKMTAADIRDKMRQIS